MITGWPWRNPPNTAFTINRRSKQAVGLLGWWPTLANPGSNILFDLTGVSNGSLGASTNPSWAIDPEMGYVLNYDGADDVVSVGSALQLDDVQPMSLVAWINPTTLGESSGGRIFDKASATTPVNGWCFQLSNTVTSSLAFNADFPTVDLLVRSPISSIVLSTWQHVAATWDGSATATNVHLYIGGVETAYSVQTSGTGGSRVSDAAQNLFIGNGPGSTRTFNGLIGDARFYNRILSPAEVWQSYTNRWELYQPIIRRRPARAATGIMTTNRGMWGS